MIFNLSWLIKVCMRFAAFKANRVEAGFAPVQEGVLIWDEVKVCILFTPIIYFNNLNTIIQI